MNDHIDDDILDYIDGRMSVDDERALLRHCESCPDCAADLAWAKSIADRVAAGGLRHLTPDRLVAVASGGDQPTAAERWHLEHCPDCRAELGWAGGIASREDASATGNPAVSATRKPTTPSSFQWGFLLGAAVAVTIIIAIVAMCAQSG